MARKTSHSTGNRWPLLCLAPCLIVWLPTTNLWLNLCKVRPYLAQTTFTSIATQLQYARYPFELLTRHQCTVWVATQKSKHRRSRMVYQQARLHFILERFDFRRTTKRDRKNPWSHSQCGSYRLVRNRFTQLLHGPYSGNWLRSCWHMGAPHCELRTATTCDRQPTRCNGC